MSSDLEMRAQVVAALNAVTMLEPLGGMMPGSRDVVMVVVDMAKDALSALSQQPSAGDGWQPIATAPRDGTKVIGCHISQNGTVEHVGGYSATSPNQRRWSDGEWSVYLTHWIPAPKSEQTK